MGAKSKRDGARFEAMAADIFRAAGWVSDRLRSFRVKGEPDLYATKYGIVLDIQAKQTQSLNVNTVLSQLQGAQKELERKHGVPRLAYPIVLWRRMKATNGDSGRLAQAGSIVVAIDVDDFIEILGVVSSE